MRNRAKCRLCKEIIESFHQHDYIVCSCGEIGVDGGTDLYRVIAKDFSNFIRIDDSDREIDVTFVDVLDEKKVETPKEDSYGLSKEDKLSMLENMCKNIENLPAHIINEPISHYDLYSALTLVLSIFRS
jgi:hypothetical protein